MCWPLRIVRNHFTHSEEAVLILPRLTFDIIVNIPAVLGTENVKLKAPEEIVLEVRGLLQKAEKLDGTILEEKRKRLEELMFLLPDRDLTAKQKQLQLAFRKKSRTSEFWWDNTGEELREDCLYCVDGLYGDHAPIIRNRNSCIKHSTNTHLVYFSTH
jgi:hypothetical protein